MKNKKFVVWFVVFCATFLSGCSNNQELHQKLIIQGIAVDKTDNGYLITAQAFDFQNPQNEDEPSVKLISVDGRTLFDALGNISKKTSLTPVYSQNLILVLGQSVAQNGVNKFMDFFVRHCEARPKAKICICQGNASEILSFKQDGKLFKAKNIHDLIPDNLNSDVLHFVSGLKSGISDPCAAWVQVHEESDQKLVALKGVAIFSGDVLTGLISGEDAFGFMALKGVTKFSSCVINIFDVADVTCEINKIKVKINPQIIDSGPNFEINVIAEVATFAVDSDLSEYSEQQIKSQLSEKFTSKFSDILYSTIKKIQSLNSDALNFNKIFRNKFPQYFKRYEKDRASCYKCFNYTINQTTHIAVTGKEPL